MAQESVRYGLRARQFSSKHSSVRNFSSEAASHPAAAATIAAGLQIGVLSKAELLAFRGRTTGYLQARNLILEAWEADVSQHLALQSCLAKAEAAHAGITAEAYHFLAGQGCINFGLLQNEPDPGADLEASLKVALYDLLQSVNLDSTTEKMIRKQLEAQLQADLDEHRPLIRLQVQQYLEGKLRAPPPAASAAAGPTGQVIVVGAGPAGLTAALHLQRRGVKVTVLEARPEVGGRVRSSCVRGFTTPVDMGASIITGTQVDTIKGLRPDPSAVIARQLGLKLHVLDPTKLPLYDGLTGQLIPDDMDLHVNGVRDMLLDAARERVDTLGEAAVDGESLGDALEAAYAAFTSRAQQAQADSAAPQADSAGVQAESAKLPADSAPAQSDSELLSLLTTPRPDTSTQRGPSHKRTAQHESSEVPAADSAPASTSAGPLAEVATAAAPSEAGAESAGQLEDLAAQAGDAQDQGGTDAQKLADADARQLEEGAEGASGLEAALAGVDAAVAAADSAEEREEAQQLEQAHALQEEASRRQLTEAEARLLGWHWANLEYGCSSRLRDVSLAHWNQDEEHAGFGGPHCMVVGGYSQITAALSTSLDVRLDHAAQQVSVTDSGVRITCSNGESVSGGAAIVTVPLGCLKAGAVAFRPPLPAWKLDAIAKLGFGALNKVALQFPSAFWPADVDFFGAAIPGGAATRGNCFMFWSLQRFCNAPVLLALLAGEAAYESEGMPQEQLQEAALKVLRQLYGAETVPQPTAVDASQWMCDEFSKGSYSYVARGASAKTYDQLALPVHRRLLFAGEHTCKEHPDTVGGAMLTGLREAVRAIELLKGDRGEADAEAVEEAGGIAAPEPRRKRKMAMPSAAAVELAEAVEADDSAPARKRKKRKERSSAREGSAEEEPWEAATGATGRRAAAVNADAVRQEQEGRANAKKTAKATWSAILRASSGDTGALIALIGGTTDQELQAVLLGHLLQAPADALEAVSYDADVLAGLNAWLQALLDEQRTFHIVELILQLLQKLPVQWHILQSAQIPHTVRNRIVTHHIKTTRELAAAVIHRWVEANQPEDQQPSRSLSPLLQPGAFASGLQNGHSPDGENGIGEDVARQNQAQQLAEAREKQVEAERRLAEAQEAFMDPQARARIAALEAELQQAQEEEAAFRDQASHLESAFAQEQAAKAGQLPVVHSFEAFMAAKSGRKSKHKHKRKPPTASHPAPKRSSSGTHMGSHQGSHQSHAASQKPSSQHGSNQAEKQLTAYVREVLAPEQAGGKISAKGVDWVTKKAVHKVLEKNGDAPGKDLLSSRHKAKVKDLVIKYVRIFNAGSTNK